MSTTHTPGPWHWVDSLTDLPYEFGGDNAGYPSLRTEQQYGENKTEIRDGKSYTSFALPKFIVDAEPIENPGDARLIAAAPELLEALTELERQAEISLDYRPEFRRAIAAAHAAIANATGSAA